VISPAAHAWTEAEEALSHDPRLGPVVRRVGPCGLAVAPPGSLFGALLRSIVYQQLNGRAAATIHGRVVRLFPSPARPAAGALEKIPDEALRAAGLSRGKLAAVRDLGAHARAGRLPTLAEAAELPDDELVRRLTVVRGIGPWTVHMLLIFHLGRPDVWPRTDYGVRAAVGKLWRKRVLPDERFMERVGRAWRPWRSVASWYLWRSHELAPETKRVAVTEAAG
jgi:3-methyladenine DNA glycosylase/8-oxoguanine DNA glycosylase